jgi:putative ABC transport system ATP-binding protein
VLSVRNLSKSYGGPAGRSILENISFDLARGDYIAIMGESGSGKSTLLNLIAGLENPDAGTITLDGAELGALSDDERTRTRAAKMGFVFQAFHLLPHLTVEQNVTLPLVLNGVPEAAIRERVERILAAVDVAERARDHPRELSGGEMQRVAIARALVHRPRLVLADEPTGNLDQETAFGVLHLLRERALSGGAAGILVTHSMSAAATAQRVYELRNQRLFSLKSLAT